MDLHRFEQQARRDWERIPRHFKEGVDGVVVSADVVPHPELADVFTMGECITEKSGRVNLGLEGTLVRTGSGTSGVEWIDATGQDPVRARFSRSIGLAGKDLPRVSVESGVRNRLEHGAGDGDIEADRAVLDAVREALLHLVRNAVSHGIERPALFVPDGPALASALGAPAGTAPASLVDRRQGSRPG